MMNVKKYRATTTREALEKIKQDLGEDAFVLDTKQIRTGGFLGLRSEMQIEISAAAPAALKTKFENPAKAVFTSAKMLNLTDDTIALPNSSEAKSSEKKENILQALSARDSSSNDFETEIFDAPKAEQTKFESVEISSEAPRFVYPKKEMAKVASTAQNVSASPIFENSAANSNRELELLRAEMRELKFSFGAFANRQNVQSWQTGIDLDLFGEVFDSPFYDCYVELTGTGISPEFARQFIAESIPHFRDNSLSPKQLSQKILSRAASSLIKFEPDALQLDAPTVLAVIGATGVGKTTTVAKLAARAALHERRRVELVTLDTYRIAAVEQLKTYAEIIGAGCHVVRSVLELDSVLRRMPTDAVVLIDTTGKSPHDLADQFELSDYLRQREEIRKYLAIQATTHPLDAIAAVKKFEMYGADNLILTKMDETMRPGAILEVIHESNLPLAYLCMGQRVPEDLQIASAETLTARIIGN
jgi:flagellar biosynthesis protein FlhF